MSKIMVVGIIVGLLVTAWFCATETSGSTVINYQITASDLSGGWTATADGAKIYATQTDLCNAVNGDCVKWYEFPGLTETLVQSMDGPNGARFDAYVMSYATEGSADLILEDRRTLFQGNTFELPPFDETTAFYKPGMAGIEIFAQIGSCYINLLLDGYDDETLAKQFGAQLLAIYETKING